MNKVLKYALIALAVLLLVAVAVAVYLAATFDANAYKPKIIQLVKERTQRTLAIPGDIKLTFFPGIGVSLGTVTLSDAGSDTQFASVDELRVSLGLLPLLQKQIEVDDVHVKGLRANLVRYPDGRLNIDDLLRARARGAEGQAPTNVQEGAGLPMFALSSVTIGTSAVTFRDEKANAKYAVTDIDLRTGRIANATASTLDLSAKLKASNPELDLAAQFKSGLTFDLERRRLSLKEIALDVQGDAAGLTKVEAKLRGSADADMAAPAIEASKIAFAVTGNIGKDAFDFNLALPRLKLTRETVDGERMGLRAAIKSAAGTTSIDLAAPRLEGSAKTFKIVDLALEVDAARGEQTWKARVSGSVDGQLDETSLKPTRVSMNPLGVQATLSGPNVPNKSVTGNLQGSGFVDVEKQRAQTELAGTFDESNVKVKLSVAGFTPPGYGFEVEIDKLDLTRYQPTKPAPATAPDAKPGPEEPIDLSALKALNANGSIRIGALKASKIKASNVRIDVKALNGRVDIDPVAANLYGGSLSGAIGVNAQGTPRFSVKQTLAGVSFAPMLMDIANFQRVEGRGNFALNVTTAGQTVTQLRQALNGTAAANLVDGAIRGINIAATIREAKTTIAQLKGQPRTAAADTTQKTNFAELKATFNIVNGVASNRDLVMTAPALRVVGEGNIDLGNARMNYLLKARLAEAGSVVVNGTRVDLASIAIPVRVTGALEAPTYQFDFGDLAASVAGQALQDQIQKKLGGKVPPGAVGDVLQDAVKGLFKR